MKTVQVIVIDDEPLARRRITELLEKQHDFEISGECGSVRHAAEMVIESQPDAIFLDIKLPDADGFSLFQQINENCKPAVVVVSAFDKHALQAFDFDAVDYLLKPFDDERFSTTLERLRQRLRNGDQSDVISQIRRVLENAANPSVLACEGRNLAKTETPNAGQKIEVKSGSRTVYVDPATIEWIEAHGSYLRIHTGTESYLKRQTMADIESELDKDRFVRVHRSTIVNLYCVSELLRQKPGEYFVVMSNGQQLKISQKYRQRIQYALRST